MEVTASIPLLDDILVKWKPLIGEDFVGYRNHCTRMAQFCFALAPNCTPEDREKIVIAAAFHDIGIWIDNTVDYIPTSLPPAMDYLAETGRESWAEEIRLMITEHHKLTPFDNPRFPLVEVFRKGDLVDFSLGSVRHGLPKSFVHQMRTTLPNAGFHTMLLKRGLKWFARHPLNPAPMMKW